MFSSLSYHLLAHTERRFRKSICGNDKVIDIFVILQDREAKDAAVRTVGGTGYHAATRSDIINRTLERAIAQYVPYRTSKRRILHANNLFGNNCFY